MVVRLGRAVDRQLTEKLTVSLRWRMPGRALGGLDVSSVVCRRNRATRECTRHLTVPRDHSTAAQGPPAAAAGRLETAAAAPLAAPARNAGCLYPAGIVRSVRQSVWDSLCMFITLGIVCLFNASAVAACTCPAKRTPVPSCFCFVPSLTL